MLLKAFECINIKFDDLMKKQMEGASSKQVIWRLKISTVSTTANVLSYFYKIEA